MLLNGINHIAVLTKDTDALHAFYREVFDATISRDDTTQPGFRFSLVDVGPYSELNVFEIADNSEAEQQTPMFARASSTTSACRPHRWSHSS